MDDIAPTAKNPVKAVRTTVELLEVLNDLDGARVTELADELGYPKSSVHNYLSTLRERGYVVKEGDVYHVGIRFLEFGSRARQRRGLYEIARPEIRELARETGELANLLVEDHGKGIYVYRETGRKAVNVDSYTGQRVHLHNTALGKAMLAHFPRERVERILDAHGLPETTDRTVTDRDELFERLADIRRRGVAFDDEERLSGLRCVAVPIVDKDGVAVGAISVSGPSSRFKGDWYREELPELLGDAANVIELNITYG